MEISESSDAIRRRILDDAEKEAQKLIAQADEKAEEILNTARERAKDIRDAELDRRKKHIEETNRQRIAETKVEHHRRLQTFKSGLIDDTFNEATERLKKYVEKPAYSETLTRLIIEGATALGGGDLLLKLNKADKKRVSKETLKRLADEISKATKIETTLVLNDEALKNIGGAVISTADQKATVDNTFEARLERIREEAKAEVETILFK